MAFPRGFYWIMNIAFFSLQPGGINKVASKKGKVFGDTHDGHRLTQQQIEELNQVISQCQ